jgi:hypothetical protein
MSAFPIVMGGNSDDSNEQVVHRRDDASTWRSGILAWPSLRRMVMTDVKDIERAVEALAPDQLAAFRRWFADFDMARWDREASADLAAGKLDEMLEEADRDWRTLPHRAV